MTLSAGWFISLITFALVWWTVLFCVLPVGARPDPKGEGEAGGWRGTPTRPLMRKRLVWTTAITAVIWAGIMIVMDSNLISFRDEWLAIPDR